MMCVDWFYIGSVNTAVTSVISATDAVLNNETHE